MNCRLPIADCRFEEDVDPAIGIWQLGIWQSKNRQSAIGNGSLLCCFGP
jgi:hypothetical protein